FHKFRSQKNIDYYPGDIFPHLYPSGTKHFDLLNPSMPHNSFDAIICNHVFQYIPDDKTAMQTVYDLIKPGGWGILQVPINGTRQDTYEDDTITDPIEREKAFGLTEHVRYYGLDYAEKLRSFGFKVLVDNYSAAFSDEEIYRYGFWKNDPVYYVTK
ncbi:MAG: methyltransferase domain-containing protein, partial [Pedobacter sp.]